MPETIFTPEERWWNGFYTLVIDLEERSDERCRSAMESLKSYPPLDCWYLEREKEPQDQPRVNAGGDLREHRYGVLTLPNGKKVPCGCFIFHTDFQPDWLEFYIPLASLDRIYPTGAFPFGVSEGYSEWEREVDAALVGVARHIFQHVPFPAGAIGFELTVDTMEEIYYSAIAEMPPQGIRNGYLWAGKDGLEWHPPKDSPRF